MLRASQVSSALRKVQLAVGPDKHETSDSSRAPPSHAATSRAPLRPQYPLRVTPDEARLMYPPPATGHCAGRGEKRPRSALVHMSYRIRFTPFHATPHAMLRAGPLPCFALVHGHASRWSTYHAMRLGVLSSKICHAPGCHSAIRLGVFPRDPRRPCRSAGHVPPTPPPAVGVSCATHMLDSCATHMLGCAKRTSPDARCCGDVPQGTSHPAVHHRTGRQHR